MDGWLGFVIERYNYWIVITLMMTGLYTVFSRGNLVKKLIGLNLFQTSVFIYYITMGKIAGGTAPIYIGGELDHANGHGAPADGEGLHGAPANELPDAAGLHEKIDNAIAGNDLKAAVEALGPGAPGPDAPSLHEPPAEAAGKISNQLFENMQKPEGLNFDAAGGLHEGAGSALAEVVHLPGDIVYTNPLPHVLILTAIVVGVATTAVGLALAVRIREAYGTIEEDELEAIDHLAEFGAPNEGAP